jgi:hypothetical protein
MTPSNVTAATVQNPHNLETLEVNDLALQVLQLLDGLTVGAVREVCTTAAGLASNYTFFDVNSAGLRTAVAAHQQLCDESAQRPGARS